MAKHTPHHSHLNPRQFNRKLTKDPGEQEKPKFGDSNTSKTMKIDSPRLPHPPKRHPHRRHAGARTKRAMQNTKRAS